MKFLTAITLSVCLLFSFNSLKAKDDKKKPANELTAFAGGVVYSLPRTGIRITVEANQVKTVHGPYNAFAQKYLGIEDAPKTDDERWTIRSVRMETYGEPDPAAVFKATGTYSTLLSLSSKGVLLGIKSNIREQVSEKVVTTLFPSQDMAQTEPWTDLSMHSFLAEKDTTKRSGTNFKSFEEKAAEAASDILKLRKRKALLLASKYDKLPPDGEAYRVAVAELDRIIGQYLSLFVGRKTEKSYTQTFDVVPDGKSGKGIVAFRFSPTAGILPESNVSGKPVMLEIEPVSELKQKVEATAGNEANAKGVFYRIPVVANARLINGTDVMAQARFALAQFGVVSALPDGLLGGDYSIEFHPETGAIKFIGAN
ncbi:MAG: DUF4831 family protein [Marinilabiliales bacterium]|nr:DUF4831 family protein [Marinilabiliales bacterium]